MTLITSTPHAYMGLPCQTLGTCLRSRPPPVYLYAIGYFDNPSSTWLSWILLQLSLWIFLYSQLVHPSPRSSSAVGYPWAKDCSVLRIVDDEQDWFWTWIWLDLDLIISSALQHPRDLGLAASHLAQWKTTLPITSLSSQQVFSSWGLVASPWHLRQAPLSCPFLHFPSSLTTWTHLHTWHASSLSSCHLYLETNLLIYRPLILLIVYILLIISWFALIHFGVKSLGKCNMYFRVLLCF